MPKAGPSPLEWKRRLEAFARGEYVFYTGQKPRKGSRWHRDLCAIEACPTHGKPVSARDPNGDHWSVNVATTRYQQKLVKFVGLSLYYTYCEIRTGEDSVLPIYS